MECIKPRTVTLAASRLSRASKHDDGDSLTGMLADDCRFLDVRSGLALSRRWQRGAGEPHRMDVGVSAMKASGYIQDVNGAWIV